jgi:hypothetical protein
LLAAPLHDRHARLGRDGRWGTGTYGPCGQVQPHLFPFPVIPSFHHTQLPCVATRHRSRTTSTSLPGRTWLSIKQAFSNAAEPATNLLGGRRMSEPLDQAHITNCPGGLTISFESCSTRFRCHRQYKSLYQVIFYVRAIHGEHLKCDISFRASDPTNALQVAQSNGYLQVP